MSAITKFLRATSTLTTRSGSCHASRAGSSKRMAQLSASWKRWRTTASSCPLCLCWSPLSWAAAGSTETSARKGRENLRVFMERVASDCVWPGLPVAVMHGEIRVLIPSLPTMPAGRARAQRLTSWHNVVVQIRTSCRSDPASGLHPGYSRRPLQASPSRSLPQALLRNSSTAANDGHPACPPLTVALIAAAADAKRMRSSASMPRASAAA